MARLTLPKGKVIATDVDPEMVRHVHHKVLSDGIANVQIVLADPKDPGVSPAAHVVFVWDVIHHVHGREAWLQKMFTEMKPRAKLAVIKFKEGKLPDGPPEGVKIPKAKLSAMLRVAGSVLSGRLDLNLRQLAPQGPPTDFHGVAPVSTTCHPVEITEVCRTGSSHTEATNAYETTPYGAPVARLSRVRWLTPGEVAARLQVCRATVYKLCETGQLGFARVGFSIRISEPDLEAFFGDAVVEVTRRRQVVPEVLIGVGD